MLGPQHTHQRYCQINSKHMIILPSGQHTLASVLPNPYNDDEFHARFARDTMTKRKAHDRSMTNDKHQQHIRDVLTEIPSFSKRNSIATFAKRKREDTDLDNPCEDNVDEFGEGYFHPEPRCEGEGHDDIVTGDNIRENKGICAGKQCADFDSYVASVRAMAENGYNSNTDTHEVIDPFNRQPITLAALAKARPSNGMPVAEVIAPLSKDKRLDENYQFEEEGRENPNQDDSSDSEEELPEQVRMQVRIPDLEVAQLNAMRHVLTNANVRVDLSRAGIVEIDVHERIITNAVGVNVHMLNLNEAINYEDITSDVARQLGFAELAFRTVFWDRTDHGPVSRAKLMFVRMPYMRPNMIAETKVILVYNKDVHTKGCTFTVLGVNHHYVAVQARQPQLSNITGYTNMFEGNVMKRHTPQAAADARRSNDGKAIWFTGVGQFNYVVSGILTSTSGRHLDKNRPRVIIQDLSEDYRNLLRQHLLSVGRKAYPAAQTGRVEEYAETKLYLEFIVDLGEAHNSTQDTVLSFPYTWNMFNHARLAVEVPSDEKDMYVPSDILLHATQSPTQAKSQSPTFAKRKREDTDLDNPCEDNVDEFGEGYFRAEPRCEGEGHDDVVTGENIREGKGICAGKQCADFDSYVESVRSIAENGYDVHTDEHPIQDPFNRNDITLQALAAARPANGMPAANVIAPLSTDKTVDDNYQFDEEGRENPDRAFVDGDEAVYGSGSEPSAENAVVRHLNAADALALYGENSNEHRAALLIEFIQNVLTSVNVDVDFSRFAEGFAGIDPNEGTITNAAGVTAQILTLNEAINSEDITSDVAKQLGFAELAFRLTVERDADGEATRSKVMFVRIPYMSELSSHKVIVVYNKDVLRSTTFTMLGNDNHYVAVQARRPQLSNITIEHNAMNMFQGNVMRQLSTAPTATNANDGKAIWFTGATRFQAVLSTFLRDPAGRELDQNRPRVIVQDLSEQYRDLLRQHLFSVAHKAHSVTPTNFRAEEYVRRKLYLEFIVNLAQAHDSTRDTVMGFPYSTPLFNNVWGAIQIPSDAKDLYVPSEIVTELPLHATQRPTQAKSGGPSNVPLMQYAEISPREVLAMSPKQIDKYNGFMITEKVDGWYVTWDGMTLRTKSGHILPAPESFKAKLPKASIWIDDMGYNDTLSGELVLFHDELAYQATDVASLRRKDGPWDHAQIAFFDIPSESGKTYSWRYKRLLYHERQHRKQQNLCFEDDGAGKSIRTPKPESACIAGTSRYVRVGNRDVPAASYVIQANVIDEQNNLRQIVETMQTSAPEGFEGYVVTDPNSLYEDKRVGRMTRVKIKVRRDSEAKVVGYNPRSLKVVTTFENTPQRSFHLGIGLTNEQKKNLKKHFPLHSLVKYSYRSLTKNYKPKEARILGRRHAQDVASTRTRKPKSKRKSRRRRSAVTKKKTKHDKRRQQLLNHLRNGVYVRLKPGIAGVGVFAVRDIPANTNPFATTSRPCRKQKLVKIPKSAVAQLGSEVQTIIHDFYGSDELDSYIDIPSEGPNDNDISYYMNESQTNWNVRPATHKDCELIVFETTRVIKTGEELLTNYNHQQHAQPAAVPTATKGQTETPVQIGQFRKQVEEARKQAKLRKQLEKQQKIKRKEAKQASLKANPPAAPTPQLTCALCDTMKDCQSAQYHRRTGGLCPERGEPNSWFVRALQLYDNRNTAASGEKRANTAINAIFTNKEISEMRVCLRDRVAHQARCEQYCQPDGTCAETKTSHAQSVKHHLAIKIIQAALDEIDSQGSAITQATPAAPTVRK